MAKLHTENKGAPANPDVKFEPHDVDEDRVLLWGLAFAFLGLAASVFSVWLSWRLLQGPPPTRGPVLPVSAADKGDDGRLPPQPRLEALEDLRKENPRLLPSRAAEYLAPQEKQLEGIEKTFSGLKLPARKNGERAPESMPSKASSGRELNQEGK